MKSKLLFAILLMLACLNLKAQKNIPQLGKNSISEVIKAMTLEEKASLVVGTGLRNAGSGPVIGEADGKVPGAAGNTIGIKRLGIPGTVLADGPAGVRIDYKRNDNNSKTYYATAWPVGTLLASTWDTTLVRNVGRAFGNEVKEYGIDIILGPGMNIQRNPLNGRNFEYFSEDPYVTGYIASAMVNGLQSNGIGATLKHFAANNQETMRGSINAIISERALREIYLRGFEIAVKKSNPWCIMSSYNKLNGSYTSENIDLLTTVLKNEWGFKGFVMTDWYAGRNTVEQMKAGNNLIEPGGEKYVQNIIDAVKAGTLSEKQLDKNVEGILNILIKTPVFNQYNYSNTPNLKAHAAIARSAASEGMVLLKNKKNTLPLTKSKNIALFGNASYNTCIGGTGSGKVYQLYSVPIAEGLTNVGCTLNKELQSDYNAYIQKDKINHPEKMMPSDGKPRMIPELEIQSCKIANYAQDADIAIYTIGRNSGEGADSNVNDNFMLNGTEKKLIQQISEVFHAKNKKLIVLINAGAVIETASWKDYADAILLVWQPGQEAGNAIADLLSGKTNPSGKLATTFAVKYEDIPSSKNFPGTPIDHPKNVIYEEGVYIGYRYFNTFGVKTSYPFGFGLSYTTFSYTNLKLSSSNFSNTIRATVTITNTGKVAGKEVVQLYLNEPVESMDKPAEELKGFAKTKLLKPDESQTITFTLNAKDLASFNTTQSAWIADAGNYSIKIGASSEDIRQIKSFTLANDLIVEKVHKVMIPQVEINELRRK